MIDQYPQGVAAEEFLLQLGAIKSRDHVRRRMLLCVGCIWFQKATADKSPDYTVRELSECGDNTLVGVRRFSEMLVSTGVVAVGSIYVPIHPQTRTYDPIDDTQLGVAFQEILEVPETCQRTSTDD